MSIEDDLSLVESAVFRGVQAARKLETMYARREVSPRAELDLLIELLGGHDIQGVAGYGLPVSNARAAFKRIHALLTAPTQPHERAAGERRCVCGHARAQHEPPADLGRCMVAECACGPGCIHDGYVDRAPAADDAGRPVLPGFRWLSKHEAVYPGGAEIRRDLDAGWLWWRAPIVGSPSCRDPKPSAVQAAAYALGYEIIERAGWFSWAHAEAIGKNQFSTADGCALAALEHDAGRGAGEKR